MENGCCAIPSRDSYASFACRHIAKNAACGFPLERWALKKCLLMETTDRKSRLVGGESRHTWRCAMNCATSTAKNTLLRLNRWEQPNTHSHLLSGTWRVTHGHHGLKRLAARQAEGAFFLLDLVREVWVGFGFVSIQPAKQRR